MDGADLGAHHAMAGIAQFIDVSGHVRLGEARPPRSRVILIERRIEWCPIHDIHIDTWSLVIVVLIGEWSLGSFFLCDFVLDWGESVFEILFGEFFEFFSPCFLDISFASTSFFVERVSEC